jgi:hypothetical protein
VVGRSRSCSWPAVPVPVHTWQAVRLVGADSPRGASRPSVLRFRRMFLSAFVSIPFSYCVRLQGVWRTVRVVSTDGPRGVLVSRTVRGVSTDRPIFGCVVLDARVPFMDSLPQTHGRSTEATQMVGPELADGPPRLCRSLKSFAS